MTITAELTTKIDQAVSEELLSQSARENLLCWLNEDRYESYRDAIVEHIESGQWKELDDAFWTIIPFGTGGRRGRMYPFGSNAINDRTIGESAQGLADYLNRMPTSEGRSCAIAYDTRHRSRHFAELCASIMVANGFDVVFLDDYRATPQLSFAVRRYECTCGIMVTASHNPPSDNAVKVYWSTGGQILPPHDKSIIECVMQVDHIRTTDFQESVEAGKVRFVTDEVDREYLEAVKQFSMPGPRDCKIIFSPLHGVGSFATLPLLKESGFEDVIEYQPHAEPNGDFPNVPGHVSNPENTVVFDSIIEFGKEVNADLILATDPDCDRMGCATPVTSAKASDWRTLNGNQLGAILTDFVLRKTAETKPLSQAQYVIKTLVTSELTRKIANSYGVRCEGNIHVGFKWIAGLMDECGPEGFLFGTEESHGFLIGTHARDKDGAVACLLMAQLVADLKANDCTLHQRMDELYVQHGLHMEQLVNVQMEGSEGMEQMRKVMAAFRTSPPKSLGGIDLLRVRDYQRQESLLPDGRVEPLDGPPANMVVLDLHQEGNYVAVRPSGTEPKVKFYFFTALGHAESSDLSVAKQTLANRIEQLSSDIRAFVSQV